MKRDFLEGLGLEKDIIDRIMTENGKDIENAKGETKQLETDLKTANKKVSDLKIQLETANTTIKDFENEDVEGIKQKIRDYEEDYSNMEAKLKGEMEQLRKDTAIELRLKDEQAKSIRATKALLDLDKISLDGNNLIGLDEQLEILKEKESYLFGKDKLSGRSPNPPSDNPVDDDYKNNPFSKEYFNLTKQGYLYKNDPEKAAKLQAAAKGK